MAQVAAPIRVLGRRLRSHWRPILVACGLVAVFASIAVTRAEPCASGFLCFSLS